MSTDDKWQLGFWLITIICGVWLVALTGNVVANDRLRSDGDNFLRDKIEILLKENSQAHSQILIQLQDLSTQMRLAQHGTVRSVV